MEEIKFGESSGVPAQRGGKRALIGVIGTVIFLAIIIGVVVGVSGGNGSIGYSYLSYSNYTRITNGMSYSEVVNVLDGHSGVLDSSSSYGGYTLSYYSWSNGSGTKCIVVGFENGKVCSKTQYGLS